MNRIANILSTGRSIPERRIDNAELERIVGQPVHDWLVANVGIEARHVRADWQTTSDLVTAAAEQALERADVPASAVDLVIVATDTPDHLSPATASVVQYKLGATRAGVFDINAACAGWVTALDLAARVIATDRHVARVLVCGGYGMSRFLDWRDKNTATLFADGAGAVLLGAGDRPGFLAGRRQADGQYHDALGIYTGGAARPATPELTSDIGRPRVQFVRKFPATFNTERWPALVRATLDKAGVGIGEVSLFLFTQLNLRTIEAVMDVLGQPREKAHWIMDKWGYTGSACVPMALDDAVAQGRISAGDLVVLCASGGGISMAAAAIRWI